MMEIELQDWESGQTAAKISQRFVADGPGTCLRITPENVHGKARGRVRPLPALLQTTTRWLLVPVDLDLVKE